MYLWTGFGQPKVMPANDQLVETCQAWVVNVPFSPGYSNFRDGVTKAIERHVTGRNNTAQLGHLIAGLEPVLRNMHNSLQSQSTKLAEHGNNVPIRVTLYYSTGSIGRLWKIDLALLGGLWTTL